MLPGHLQDPDLINNHFISCAPSLLHDSHNSSEQLLSSDFASVVDFHLPTMDEVGSSVLRLGPYVTGPDGISGRMLQLSLSFIIGPLTHIINASFERGFVPQSWKYCSTFPILKKPKKVGL